jgi:SAM-dependent methyltransferase
MTPPPGGPRSLSEADSFEDEKSVEINFEDPSRPGIVQMQMDSEVARPVTTRAATVALSDDDLEELMDGGGDAKKAKPNNLSGETVALSDTDLEEDSDKHPAAATKAAAKPPAPVKPEPVAAKPDADAPKLAKATKEESGEIVVDVVEEIDSGDVATPVPPPPTTLRGLGSPGTSTPTPPTSNPAVVPPSQAKAPAGGNGAPAHKPPPTPPKGEPVTAPAQAKAPPPAPPKKPATPAGATTAAAVAAAVKAPAADKRQKRSKPWFEEIFDEDYLRTLPFLTPQATQSEAQFVVDVLSVQPGAQLLDLGCGYGRHAMELAARGFHLVGLDLSLPLLLRGADEAQRRGLSINFVHADMRELDFDAQFDGVYCLFSTFGFFDDETNKKTATAVARALTPGGRFVIEVLNRDYVIGELPTRVWWEGDGCVVLEEVEFNYFSSRIHSNRSVVFDDGRQIEQEISIRAYSLHELGKLLHAAGFRVVEVSGSVHTRGRYFGNHSRHIIVVAEKKPRDGADGK